MAGFGTWLRGVFGRKEGPDPGPGLPHVPTRPSGPESFAEDNDDFALSMYGQLQQRPGNLFFSPFSIRTALGITEAGARGETAAQMRVALSISSSDETQHVACAEIIQRLNAAGGGSYEMAVANSLWCQDGAPLLPGIYFGLVLCIGVFLWEKKGPIELAERGRRQFGIGLQSANVVAAAPPPKTGISAPAPLAYDYLTWSTM